MAQNTEPEPPANRKFNTPKRGVFQPTISRINDDIYLGDYDSGVAFATLQEHNVTAIVSMSDARDARWARLRNIMLVPLERHLFLPCLDTSTQDLLVHMKDTCDFIDRMLAMPAMPKPILPIVIADRLTAVAECDHDDNDLIRPRVLVHCQMAFHDVLAEVKGKRKIKPNPNFMEQLKVWGEVGYQLWGDEEGTVPKEPYRLYLEGRAVRLKEKGLTGNESIGIPSLV